MFAEIVDIMRSGNKFHTGIHDETKDVDIDEKVGLSHIETDDKIVTKSIDYEDKGAFKIQYSNYFETGAVVNKTATDKQQNEILYY